MRSVLVLLAVAVATGCTESPLTGPDASHAAPEGHATSGFFGSGHAVIGSLGGDADPADADAPMYGSGGRSEDGSDGDDAGALGSGARSLIGSQEGDAEPTTDDDALM